METEKAILGRRSVREYEKKDVPEQMIAKLLKAGAMAGSTMDQQPCRYIVITNSEKIKWLSEKVKEKGRTLEYGQAFKELMNRKEDIIFYGAPLLILIVAEKNDWAQINCSVAAQNMLLMAYDLGLGSCFIGFANFVKDERDVLRVLGIEDNQELVCPLIFGYPKKWPEPKVREAKVQKIIS